MNKILSKIYKYSILLVSLFLFLKCYEYYFFNEFYIKIPDLIDISYEEAKLIERKGLRLKIIGELSSSKPAGIICKQNPHAGFLIKRGSNIKIFVSKGLKNIRIPDVKYEMLDDVQKIFKHHNIAIDNTDFVFDENVEFNRVMATDPDINNSVPSNSKVSLLVSKGAINKVTFIPDIIGLDFETVKDTLITQGLLIGKVVYKKSSHDMGTVLDIDPKVGDKVFRGSVINFTIAE